MNNVRWHFSIDVGGTFTDCLAIPPSGDRRIPHKLLSSGVTTGIVESVDLRTGTFVDPDRRADPADFWVGYRCRFFAPGGRVLNEKTVVSFDRVAGTLRLDGGAESAAAGVRYELASNEEAPLVAIRYILGLPLSTPMPALDVRLGTTRGTNALLTRTGARTAFVTTRGFRDILSIRDQQRPRLFDLNVVKQLGVHERVLEVDERVTASGKVLRPVSRQAVRDALRRLMDEGVESLAVCLLHAYAFPKHEQQIGEIAHEVGFTTVSLSSSVAPVIKLVSRGDTTVASAYLNPVLQDYVRRINKRLNPEATDGKAVSLRLMTSSGGLISADKFDGKDSLLSGPAGGVVGYARAATAAGFRNAIGFDMGGTSTDVSRFGGDYDVVHEIEKNGIRIVGPALAIETVAAGGGSICGFDGVQLAVGPDSAGADPGPACYGRGGPLTVTDLNVALGRIQPDRFAFPLDVDVVHSRLAELCQRIADSPATDGPAPAPLELAEGLLRVANANMTRAIQSISTARGYDPRDHVLVPFGGAAGQHACAVSREIEIETILSLPDAGILSAVGIHHADVVQHEVRGIYRRLDPVSLQACDTELAALSELASNRVHAEGIRRSVVQCKATVDLRYMGQEAYLTIDFPGGNVLDAVETLTSRFHTEHRRLFGFGDKARDLEIVAARVTATGRNQPPASLAAPPDIEAIRAAKHTTGVAHPKRVPIFFDGEYWQTPVYRREELRTGDVLLGPAIITERLSTTVVECDWRVGVLDDGKLLIVDCRCDRPTPAHQASTKFDPVLLEVFSNAFEGIAEQMGATLQKTSSSVNVKERLDFSCAIFTGQAELVVNAPHMPVHLGAMSETVRCVAEDHPGLSPGDVIVTNDPYRGGSHLPDITVLTPVFDVAGETLLFYTASRAHHAEIGGTLPGSMPPFSTRLAEEGVLIRSQKVIDRGESRLASLREVLSGGPYPSRDVENNLADLAAQVAANQQGAVRLGKLIEGYGQPVVLAYMKHIQSTAEQKMRLALSALPDGRCEFADALDDGSPIRVAITIEGDTAEIDFEGSAGIHPENLNANPAIVRAAVLYVMRCLVHQDIPLNDGMLKPISICIPEGILNPPDHGDPERNAAVVGGNVETSQRLVDVLLGALGLAAASQGTMNNFLFGDDGFGYYETICGGTGATANGHGADAVHSHMTNTRLTDPEVLEHRFPVRLLRFELRSGSGGHGKHTGGDGVLREIEFLEPLDVSLLTQRRDLRPYGLRGGEPGKPGVNRISRAGGAFERLPGRVQLRVGPGDILRIETPGGGGFGA